MMTCCAEGMTVWGSKTPTNKGFGQLEVPCLGLYRASLSAFVLRFAHWAA